MEKSPAHCICVKPFTLSHVSPSCWKAMRKPWFKWPNVGTQDSNMQLHSQICLSCRDGEGSTTNPVNGWFKNQVLTEAARKSLAFGFPSPAPCMCENPARASHRMKASSPTAQELWVALQDRQEPQEEPAATRGACIWQHVVFPVQPGLQLSPSSATEGE